MVLLILMVFLEMRQVFYAKSDEGKMLKSLTQRLYLLGFFFSPRKSNFPAFLLFLCIVPWNIVNIAVPKP